MKTTLIRSAQFLLALSLPGNPGYADQVTFSRDQLVSDFDQLYAFMLNTHPDLYRSADAQVLTAAAKQVRGSLRAGMSLSEAWLAMAKINPLLMDAHSGIRRPVAAVDSLSDSSAGLLPLTVVVGDGDRIRIGANSEPTLGAYTGVQLVAINGVDSHAIVRTLMPRMRGESVTLRRLVLSRHFAAYHWLGFGGAATYELDLLVGEDVRRLKLSAQVQSEQLVADAFSYRLLDRGAAYLEVRTFDKAQQAEFASFLNTAFAQIKHHRAHNLIIDLRRNGGGAHELSDELMRYLTANPYSYTSAVKARVSSENIARIPGAQLGEIVDVPYRQTMVPPASEPLRFAGQVYLLIGPGTYSQAIAFAAAAQDHAVATLAGEPTEGPANQTGQVQLLAATHTKLEAMAPLYVFTRASGEVGSAVLEPEIDISDRPAQPMHSVNALIRRLPILPEN